MSIPDIKIIQDAKVLLQIIDEIMDRKGDGLTINIFMVQLSQNNVNGDHKEIDKENNSHKITITKEELISALEKSDWLQMKAAMLLGFSHATISRLCKEHGIVHPKWQKRNLITQ